MDTLLIRLKRHDPRRGYVLRRYTYRGIKFHDERGWYRVEKSVAEYLRSIRQVAGDEHSPPAFDVCTDEEAKALDAKDKEGTLVRASAAEDIKVSPARTEEPAAVTTADLPGEGGDAERAAGRRGRRG